MCSVLGIAAKSPLRADVATKFNELIGEEVAGEKTEASKLDGYAVLIAGQKAKVSLYSKGLARSATAGILPAIEDALPISIHYIIS